MKLKYFANSKCFDIYLEWFTEKTAEVDHEIKTAIEQCAKDYYWMDDGCENPGDKFPIEIALCIGNREIGRKTVDVYLEPNFECT